MLVASGFKVITPKTAAQQQKLQNLPPGKATMIQKGGKTYYIFPDPAHNRAYVGRPREYQAYQQLRATNKLATENLETAEMYQDASMQWSVWGGWDAGFGSFGPMGAQVRIDASPDGRQLLLAECSASYRIFTYLPVRLGGVPDRLLANCL